MAPSVVAARRASNVKIIARNGIDFRLDIPGKRNTDTMAHMISDTSISIAIALNELTENSTCGERHIHA